MAPMLGPCEHSLCGALSASSAGIGGRWSLPSPSCGCAVRHFQNVQRDDEANHQKRTHTCLRTHMMVESVGGTCVAMFGSFWTRAFRPEMPCDVCAACRPHSRMVILVGGARHHHQVRPRFGVERRTACGKSRYFFFWLMSTAKWPFSPFVASSASHLEQTPVRTKTNTGLHPSVRWTPQKRRRLP